MKNNFVDYNLIGVFIGKRLKEERYKYGYSLEEVAYKLGISRQRYANYEAAIRAMPMDLYVKACRIYNINPEKLFKKAQDYMREEVFKDADLQEE